MLPYFGSNMNKNGSTNCHALEGTEELGITDVNNNKKKSEKQKTPEFRN
jgi:hypothetical protein